MSTDLNVDEENAVKMIAQYFQNLDYSLLYKTVGNLLESAVASQFETDGAYFQRGLPWSRLQPSTLKQRKRLGYDQTSILRRDAGNAGLLGSFVSTFYGSTVVVGTNKYYAPYLHFGTKFMPSRILFPDDKYGLPPDLIEDIKDAFETFLELKLGS